MCTACRAMTFASLSTHNTHCGCSTTITPQQIPLWERLHTWHLKSSEHCPTMHGYAPFPSELESVATAMALVHACRLVVQCRTGYYTQHFSVCAFPMSSCLSKTSDVMVWEIERERERERERLHMFQPPRAG
jgi:hypothetical protein